MIIVWRVFSEGIFFIELLEVFIFTHYLLFLLLHTIFELITDYYLLLRFRSRYSLRCFELILSLFHFSNLPPSIHLYRLTYHLHSDLFPTPLLLQFLTLFPLHFHHYWCLPQPMHTSNYTQIIYQCFLNAHLLLNRSKFYVFSWLLVWV